MSGENDVDQVMEMRSNLQQQNNGAEAISPLRRSSLLDSSLVLLHRVMRNDFLPLSPPLPPAQSHRDSS